MNGFDRRSLFRGVAALAAVPLAGCGATAPDGRLRVAFATSGARETLDPHLASLFVDQARAKALFDTLVGYADDMTAVPRLAESWEPDAAGLRWRIRLRDARFHDGRPVTAEDVLYSYRRIADPATASPAEQQFAGVDFAASRAVSPRELELVLHAPDFEFPLAWGAPATEIVPAGTVDFTRPVGSGPFRFGSFRPGAPAVFARFDGHWSGPPSPAELEFVPINDENARVAALASGQVHYAHDISANSASVLRSDGRTRVLAAPRGTMQAVALKIDRPPFADRRLVRAVQSAVDRRALVDVALGGHGQIGNDMFGAGLRFYPADVPQRGHDLAAARSLVDAAGQVSFDLHTSAADPYFESAAALLAQQLREAGLRPTVRTGPAETYFSDIKAVGGAALTRTATLPVTTFLRQRMRADAGGGNYTGYHSPEFDALHSRALATADEAERARLLGDAQRLAREESGLVVWGFSDWNIGVSRSLSGVRAAPPNSLDWARFDRARPH